MAQFDDPAFQRLKLRQAIERFIKRQYLGRFFLREIGHIIETEFFFPAAALTAQIPARVIYKNATHKLRGDGEEMRTIMPLYLFLVDELEVDFVHQRSGLQRVGLEIGRAS